MLWNRECIVHCMDNSECICGGEDVCIMGIIYNIDDEFILLYIGRGKIEVDVDTYCNLGIVCDQHEFIGYN